MPVRAELSETDPNRIMIDADWALKELTKKIPGCNWSKNDDSWSMPVSWAGCLALRSTYRNDLEIGPRLTEWAMNEKVSRIDPCMWLREQVDAPGDPKLYGWQRSGAQFIKSGRQVLIGDDPGCIDGDAEIIIERAGGSRRMTLRELHRKFHGGASGRWAKQRWDSTISTRTKSMFGDGTLALNQVLDVMSRGTRSVLRIETRSGRSIRCTTDHSMSTGIGSWAPAGELKVGDQLTINGVATCLDEIVSIKPDGETDVYDIEMAAPAHNFVANGIVVHNSGKTATSIRGLAAIQSSGQNVFPILVVCPNSMKQTWIREFKHWWPGVEAVAVSGSALARRKILNTPAHVYVINWEGLRSHSRLASYGSIALKRCQKHGGEDPRVTETACQVHERELNVMQFGAAIADEIHRARDPKSQQTRALWGASIEVPVKIALTGTPTGGDVSDLWPILHWLSPDEWPSKTRWMERSLDIMYNSWGSPIVNGIKPEMEGEFYATLNPRFRRMPEDLVLRFLPPIVHDRRDVEMSSKQRKAYIEMRDQMVAELDGGLLTVGNSMTKMTRLLQLASSYGEVDMIAQKDGTEKPRVRLIEPSSKIDALIDDLPDFGDQQVVVAAVSRQLIELLSARLEKLKIPHGLLTGAQDERERQQSMDDFQSGKVQFILITVAAGGTGVTLTAGRYLVRLQRPWSLIDDKQLLRRVRRIGAERHETIIVRDYVTENTVDMSVIEALDSKGENFESIVKDKQLLLKALKE